MFLELLILFLTVFIVWTIKINLNRRWKNLAPAPLEWPIIGHLPQMAMQIEKSNKAPYLAFKEFSKKYGPVMTLQFGVSTEVVIDDPDLIKEVLCSDAWSDRYFDVLYGLRSFDHPYGLLFSSGEEWKEMRRFSLRTLRDFGFGKKTQATVFDEEVSELFSRLDSQIDSSKTPGQLAKSMEQFFTISVLNILWSLLAGERFSHDDVRLKGINSVTSKMLKDNALGASAWHGFPNRFTRFLFVKLTKNGAMIHKYMTEMQQFFRGMLEERRALGFYKTDQRDFIEVFLKEIDNRKDSGTDPNKNFYSEKQFLVVVLDLFLAGSETTANTLEFAILYMILNPGVQKKVQAEIDHIVGRSRLPNYAEDRVKMPYTEATLHEVQRMSSVVPLDNRNSTQDTTLGGYFVPKGTPSIINIHSVHYNPKVWGDPHVFRPERFIDDQNNIVNTNKIIPFGGGKRLCLGEAMARASLFTYFTSALQKYNFAQVPNRPAPTMEARVGFTLAPHQYDAVITYR